MSPLSVKCVGTIVENELIIHDFAFGWKMRDIVDHISNSPRDDKLKTLVEIEIGDRDHHAKIMIEFPILNNYTYEKFEDCPMPLSHPYTQNTIYHDGLYKPSRVWIYGRYLFLLNRKYDQNEEVLVAALVHKEVTDYEFASQKIIDEFRRKHNYL